MADYVTELARYTCGCNFFTVSESQDKVRLNGKRVLTKNATLKAVSPTCPLKNTPCPASFSPWQDIDRPHLAAGLALLTSSSSCKCTSQMQTIKLVMDIGNIAGIFTQGRAGAISTGEEGEAGPKASASEENKASAGPESGEGGKGEAKNNPAPAGEGSKAAAMESARRKEEAAQEDNDRPAYWCGKCDRKSTCLLPEDWKEEFSKKEPDWDNYPQEVPKVDYRQRYWGTLPESVTSREDVRARVRISPQDDEFLKAVAELIGYEKGLQGADKIFVDSLSLLPGQNNAIEQNGNAVNDEDEQYSWKYPCHHIIPARQVFAAEKYKDLLRMAHVCKYDINNGKNCIMLVSDDDAFEYEEAELHNNEVLDEKEEKSDNIALLAYRIMSRAKIQWHKGPHNYRLNQDEIEDLKSGYPGNKNIKFQNYVSAIQSHDMFQYIIKIDKKRICPAAFIYQMNEFSEMIKAHLAAFHDRPRDSFPFYVSKAALYYAHQLPASFKLIVVCREQSTLILKKLNCRLYPTGTITVKKAKHGEHKYEAKHSYEEEDKKSYEAKIKACVCFCGDIEHFIFFGQTGRASLPFHVDEKYVRRQGEGKKASDDNIEDYIKTNMYEIMRWLRRCPGSDKSAKELAKLRLKEIGLHKQRLEEIGE